MRNDFIAGAILGCALGDAAGLPYEGLSKCRGVRLLGEPDRFHFIIRHGMVSDDTEHTCMDEWDALLLRSPTEPGFRCVNRSVCSRDWLRTWCVRLRIPRCSDCTRTAG